MPRNRPRSRSPLGARGIARGFRDDHPPHLAVALVSDVSPGTSSSSLGSGSSDRLYYRLPIPLEPMKGSQSCDRGRCRQREIAAAGIVLGIIFLVLGYGRFFEIIERWYRRALSGASSSGLPCSLPGLGTVCDQRPLFFGIGSRLSLVFSSSSATARSPTSSICVIAAGFIGGVLMYGIPRSA